MKKLFVVLLSAVLLFSVAACGGKSQGEENGTGDKNTDQYGYKLIQGFNSYLELVNFRMGKVGDISVNTDKKYITEGKASMRWQGYDPSTEENINTAKNIYVPTLNISGERFDDFTSVINVQMEIFNAGTSDVQFFTSLAKVGSSISTDTTQKHRLKSGEKTVVNHPVERESLDMFMNISDITHISLKVEGINTLIYVDNLRFEYTPLTYETVDMVLDEYEICSFDKPYQQSVFYTEGSEEGMYEEVKIETNPMYTKDGVGYSLKIKSNNISMADDWPRIWFSTKYMTKVNLSSYKKTDYFYMDVYKAFDKPIGFGFALTFRNFYYGSYQNISIELPAGIGWKQVKIPLGDITVSNIDMMSFSLQNTTFRGTTIYVDNIKIVKGV